MQSVNPLDEAAFTELYVCMLTLFIAFATAF